MIIKLPIGILQSNCYLVYDDASSPEAGHPGLVVDPGGDPAPLLQEIEARRLDVRMILNTHGHFDHVAGNAYLKPLGAPLAVHPADRDLLMEGGGASWFDLAHVPSPEPSVDLRDGDEIEVGSLHVQVLHTPGHTPGSVCLYIPEDRALITGDTLFAGNVGRTDLPGGSARALTESLKRLVAFAPETVIYPGHGPNSTLAEEMRKNVWIRRASSKRNAGA